MEKTTHQHLDDEEIVIDFWELFYEFKRRIWWILLAAVLGTGAAGAYSYYLLTPQYISEAKIYVLSKETTLTSLADLQMGTQLTQDYKELIGSRPVMQEVINTLNLDITYRQLAEKLKLENPKDTRILYLTVTDSNPYMAKAIVDEIANAASDYIGEIMEMTPPKLIEDGMGSDGADQSECEKECGSRRPGDAGSGLWRYYIERYHERHNQIGGGRL